MSKRVIIVTGSSSGIGAQCAVSSAKEGYRVVITGRNKQGIDEVRENCVKVGLKEDEILVVQGDMTDESVRKDILEKTLAKFGQLDVLVNNAGMGMMNNLTAAKLEDFDKLMNINVRSAISMTQICLDSLTKTKGSVVNVSSYVTHSPSSMALFYSMSKCCIDMFTKCVALEMAPKGVRVNAVNPAATRTPLFSKFGLDAPDLFEKMGAQHPLGRVGEPEEVADLILFLANPKAGFITGQCVFIDGGRTTGGVSVAQSVGGKLTEMSKRTGNQTLHNADPATLCICDKCLKKYNPDPSSQPKSLSDTSYGINPATIIPLSATKKEESKFRNRKSPAISCVTQQMIDVEQMRTF